MKKHKECRWFRETNLSEPNGYTGFCKHYSPKHICLTHQDPQHPDCKFVAIWPEIKGDEDCCGDFVEKEKE